jgi:hypothetical protein
MLAIRCSCGTVPEVYFRSKRSMPSACTVLAIFCATVSDEPT